MLANPATASIFVRKLAVGIGWIKIIMEVLQTTVIGRKYCETATTVTQIISAHPARMNTAKRISLYPGSVGFTKVANN